MLNCFLKQRENVFGNRVSALWESGAGSLDPHERFAWSSNAQRIMTEWTKYTKAEVILLSNAGKVNFVESPSGKLSKNQVH